MVGLRSLTRLLLPHGAVFFMYLPPVGRQAAVERHRREGGRVERPGGDQTIDRCAPSRAAALPWNRRVGSVVLSPRALSSTDETAARPEALSH